MITKAKHEASISVTKDPLIFAKAVQENKLKKLHLHVSIRKNPPF